MLCISGEAGHDDLGPVLHRPAFSQSKVPRNASMLFTPTHPPPPPSELAEALGVPCWVRERSGDWQCQLPESQELLGDNVEALGYLLVELVLLKVGLEEMLDDGGQVRSDGCHIQVLCVHSGH